MEGEGTVKRKRENINDGSSEEEEENTTNGDRNSSSSNEVVIIQEKKKAIVTEDKKAPIPSHKYVVTFPRDEKALSTNPEEMQRNLRTPLNASMVASLQSNLAPISEHSMFVVSPEFAVKYLQGPHQTTLNPHGTRIQPSLSTRGNRSGPITYTFLGEIDSMVYKIQSFTRPLFEINKGTKNRTVAKPKEAAEVSQESSNDALVVAKFADAGIMVTLRSIQRLAPLEELDDDLVDFGIYNCIKEFPDVLYLRASTWVLYLFTSEDPVPDDKRNRFYRSITKRGTNANLLSKKFILIPICRESHWFLVIMCNPFPSENDVEEANDKISKGSDPKMISQQLYMKWITYSDNCEKSPVIFVLDSKYKYFKRELANPSEFHDDTVRYIIKGLCVMHQTFWEKTESKITVYDEIFKWKYVAVTKAEELTPNGIPHYSLDVPEQDNGKDCGVYVISFAKKWFEEKQRLGNYTSMKDQDLVHWFHPQGLRHERQNYFDNILQLCKLHHPEVYPKLVAANPFQIQEMIIID